MNYVDYLTAALIALLIGFFYQRNKARVANGLLANLKVGQEQNKIDQTIATNQGAINSAQKTIQNIQSEVNKEGNKDVTVKDLVDFFNNSK